MYNILESRYIKRVSEAKIVAVLTVDTLAGM